MRLINYGVGEITDRRQQFMRRVKKTHTCWLWTGAKTGAYGCTQWWGEGRTIRAHRLSFMLFVRSLRLGECVLHHCDNPLCVRPAHLYAGTKADNARDAVERRRFWQHKLTACKHGHPFSPENTRCVPYRGSWRRVCRACSRRTSLAYWRRTHQEDQVCAS